MSAPLLAPSLTVLAAQSSLVGALGLGGLWLLRRRSPLDRASWLKLALALLLALPLMPRLHVPMPQMLEAMNPPAPVDLAPIASTAPVTIPAPQPAAFPLGSVLLVLYGVGVAGMLGHLGLGLVLLRRWSRDAGPLQAAAWQSALAASGAPAGTRLLVSGKIEAPLSWGLRHPVILIDKASAARPGDAPAILAHEAAHIARADWPALMAARVATGLFWFNPLVWVLARALVQHCEEAADAQALARCEPTAYAQTLVTCLAASRHAGAVPANGMAAGHGLSRRVHQVLDGAPTELLRRSRGALAGVSGVAVLAVAASLVSFAHATPAAAPVATSQDVPVRVVHPDGAVEIRARQSDGHTVIRVVSADGRKISVTRFGPEDGDIVPPAPAEPPVPPVAPAPPVAPVPPMPPMAEADVPSREQIAHIREQAMHEAAQARAEGLQARIEAEHARAEGARARAEAAQARAEGERTRREALAEASQARREALAEADHIRTEALAEAKRDREQALAEASRARAQARAAMRAYREE